MSLTTAMLDALPDDALIELYEDPRQSMEGLARLFGVGFGTVHARLTRDAERYKRAQTVRARRLHEMAVLTVFEEPRTIIDTAGNERIDPAHVSLLQFRQRSASMMAGLLDRSLAERQQIDVTHDASPLADYIARIAASGSSIPIATIEGESRRLGDAVELADMVQTVEADEIASDGT